LNTTEKNGGVKKPQRMGRVGENRKKNRKGRKN